MQPHRAHTFLLALVLTVLATFTFSSSAATAPAPASDPLVFGAHVAQVGTQTETEALQAFEQQIGQRLGIVRVFERWNDTFPDKHYDYLKAQGYPLLLSVRAMLADGTHVSWAEIGAAPAGSGLHATMVRWARAVKAYGHPVLFSFNQEPELNVNLQNGTASDFIAAWRQFVSIFRSEAVDNVRFLWVMTEHSFTLPSADRRAAAKWYPGDAWVDGLAIDVYNWFTCRPGVVNAWTSLQNLIEPFRQFGAAHPDKHLWLAEWGSVEDPAVPGRKAQWVRDAQALFKLPAYAQFEGIAYFNKSYSTPEVQCAWSIESSASARTAFAEMSKDPFYGDAYQPGVPTNSSPTASFSGVCSMLTCRWDGSSSSDVDGDITRWQWDFGDGGTGTGAEVSHTYASAGPFTVRLVVTDNDEATGQTTKTMSVGEAQVRFAGGAVSNRNALQHKVIVPVGMTSGAGLLLFDTVNSATVTESAPTGLTGWKLVDSATVSGVRTRLWQRSLAAGEAGRPVTVNVSQYAQVALQLLVYDGTRASAPVSRVARAAETVVRSSHSTPPLPDVLAGSTVVSYWADKSPATTTWVAPAGQFVRGRSAGTSGGHLSHLVTDAVKVTQGATGGLTATADSADARATMWTVELSAAGS